MASTPAAELAQDILDDCLLYGTWPSRALDALIERALDEEDAFVAAGATRALFSIVIERLADLFEPALCEVYARLFAQVIARALPAYDADELTLRARRMGQPKRFVGGEVQRVFVLSRITLGADVAVTSVALDAMKRRFPDAEICLAGPTKNAEMFAGDPRIVPIPLQYKRTGTLRERLVAAVELRSILDEAGTLVVDPDSRLTQLGLIPVCDDARYYFFESRSYGGVSEENLSSLISLWLEDGFGVSGSRPYVAPPPVPSGADVCVSWGVGENENKRIGELFESAVTSELLKLGGTVLLDCGAAAEEKQRAEALQRELGRNLQLHEGSYASFASQIEKARLYVGYDSVGQHVAAAAGVPLISIFAGFPCQRMLARWRPVGPSSYVIPVGSGEQDRALPQVLEALKAISGS